MTGELRTRRCVGGGRRGPGFRSRRAAGSGSGAGSGYRRHCLQSAPDSFTTSSACTLLYIMPFSCPQILNIMYVYPRRTKLALDPQATLKKMLFPVQWPGDYITVEWELLFFICHFSPIIFLPPKHGRKRFCGRPTGHNFGHPLDRKQTFFKGGLKDLGMEVGMS